MGRKLIQPVNGMLQCTGCGEWKVLQNFSPDTKRQCGLKSRCKSCLAENARRHYSKNREAAHARVMRWRAANPDKVKALYERNYEGMQKSQRKAYREKPIQFAANRALNNAIIRGEVERKPCEVCGEPESEGHHWSYEEKHWLDVQWLCRKHHAAEHRRLRREKRNE